VKALVPLEVPEASVGALVAEVDAVCCAGVRAGPRSAVAEAYEIGADVDEPTVRDVLLALRPPGGG
jgi:hypothetical protein